MSNRPSLPPDRDSSKKPEPPAPTNLALRAVLTGVSIDICATKLVGLVIVAICALQIGTPDMTEDQLVDALQNMPPQFPLVLLGGVLGALVSVVAGYACARLAKRNEFRVGAIMVATSVLVGLALGDGDAVPDDLELLYILCDVACVLLGVKYGAAHNRRLEAPASKPADAPTP